MNSVSNTETNEQESQIEYPNNNSISYLSSIPELQLIVYLICVLILMLTIAASIQCIVNYDKTNESWIKTIKIDQKNDDYFRHPKY